MTNSLESSIAEVLGDDAFSLEPLSGGCVADVRLVQLRNRERLVAKYASGGDLEVEGWMLGYLAERTSLPVPAVRHSSANLLLMDYIEQGGEKGTRAGDAIHAADCLAELHTVSAASFGLERDTVIGGLPQSNTQTSSWLEFFGDQRLGFLTRMARDRDAIDARAAADLDRVGRDLAKWLTEPARPGLIHGDVWSGNVLTGGDGVLAFIDPAIYYADPAIEIAFTRMFATFPDAFYDRYAEHSGRTVSATEVEVLNLYPLLVHAILFGGGYAQTLAVTAARLAG